MIRRLAPLLLVVPLLGGCASEVEQYCEEVADRQATLTEIADANPRDAFIQALPSFRALREKAPTDIRDEWQVIVRTIEDLEAALDDAGIDPATYDVEDLPEGLSTEEQAAIEAAATEIGSTQMVAAVAAVEQQVRDVCHTPLTL